MSKRKGTGAYKVLGAIDEVDFIGRDEYEIQKLKIEL